jgi:hypothetical protein
LRVLESTQRGPFPIQFGKCHLPVLSLQAGELGPRCAHLGFQRLAGRIGDLAGRIVRHRAVLRQGIQGVFFHKILEKYFLFPALKHAEGHGQSRQVTAGRQDGRLVATVSQPRHREFMKNASD